MENDSIHKRVLRLQKKIFHNLKIESELLLGKPPKSIQTYEKENRADFRGLGKNLNPVTKSELISAVRATDITLIADFHTFNQAQRTALRIIRESIQKDEDWAIGLELVSSEFQKDLDDFQSEKISLETFHQIISYKEEWGFPWMNYSPIFEWAKQNKIKLLALNRPNALLTAPKYSEDDRELQNRDQWAAGIITDFFHCMRKQNKHPRMIVLYGELHVGTQHLPKQLRTISKQFLKAPLSCVTIHQNEPQLFWRLANERRELDTEVLKLKKNVYCVLSSTPWTKLQSLISWIEGETHDASESECDHLSMVRTYGNTISEFLNELPPSYESVSTCTIDEAERIHSLSQKEGFSTTELKLIRFHVAHNQRFYIPKVDIAYLGSPTQNGTAELAAIHLMRVKNRSETIFTFNYDDFFRLVLEASFGFFGSLILNPRRKCDLPEDHLERLKRLMIDQIGVFPFEREARLITLNALRRRPLKEFDLKEAVRSKKMTPAILMGAKYLGRILGKRLHQAVISENVRLKVIQEIFFNKNQPLSHQFEELYRELLSATDQVSTAGSKTEFL